MIKFDKVNKCFGQIDALKDVSLEIKNGEIIGLLGQNGAGKTTLMRILTGYLPATSGSVQVDGLDIASQTQHIKGKIGYLPETPPLYPNMTVKGYLQFAAQLKNVPKDQVAKQMDRVIYDCQLEDVQLKLISTLSKGYKQRVGIAQAVINDPKILILDEPTSGLDPIQVQQVRKLIKNIETQRTVILSTHVLSEIEQMAQRVLIIKNGVIISDMLIQEIVEKYSSLEDAFLSITGYKVNE